ncbi:Uncharacterised protein [Mycobacteroides abscessus subsp. massiliense]|nr:Uncharacterised protein [Mycobacteroides abscessus subsp. massiliense]SKK29139.1 Uncharacterised protein [Mycobacteroides abscessus subsp. massiliense]SKK51236.1 Uncharacterised protein [Mycobacteroides abscessus subsp. massiliense]
MTEHRASATATYRTVKVGRRLTHKRYRAVVRATDGSTSTVGKTEYHTKGEAVDAAQAHIDYMRGLTE